VSRSWGHGSTTRWRKLRAAVLHRDHHLCTIRAKGCTTHATCVDHIVPKHAGGDDAMTNLRAACEPCNLGRKRAEPREEPAPRRVSKW
jgi:5-methylcytosine-specific restriction protein A